MGCCDGPGRLPRPLQVAGADNVDLFSDQPLRQRRCLPPAGLIQWYVGLPLIAPLSVPRRFAVAHQNQSHRWLTSQNTLRLAFIRVPSPKPGAHSVR
jgi:hypothetical protein